MAKKKTAVFVELGSIELDEKLVPDVGPLDALLRITMKAIRGTDVHILEGEYPVAEGLTVGRAPVGVIGKRRSAVRGYSRGQRVIVEAITPWGHSYASLQFSCARRGRDRARLALRQYDRRPPGRVCSGPDIMPTGFAGVETGDIRIDDTVAVFAQGPIGLCATAGARPLGATTIIATERRFERMAMSRRMGAGHVVDFTATDPVAEIRRSTEGRGVDVAIEVLGTRQTFEAALRVLRSGGTLSSLDAFTAGLGDQRIATALCPGGRERMRRLMNVVAAERIDVAQLVTHWYKLDDIERAYELFASQRDGVLKAAIAP